MIFQHFPLLGNEIYANVFSIEHNIHPENKLFACTRWLALPKPVANGENNIFAGIFLQSAKRRPIFNVIVDVTAFYVYANTKTITEERNMRGERKER